MGQKEIRNRIYQYVVKRVIISRILVSQAHLNINPLSRLERG